MTSNSLWTDLRGLDGNQLLAGASRLLPPWISLLLVVVIGWQLAKMFWMFVPGTSAGDPVDIPASLNISSPSGDSSVDVQSIADAHLFGVASKDDETQQVTPTQITDDLPDTRLTNLLLKGTIASDFPEDSAAIIADGNQEEQVYAIGEPVTSGAKLHAVYADRVVLNENGQLTNLELPKEFPEGTNAPTRRVSRSTQRTAKDTRSIQSVVAQNISKLSDVIRPTPYFVNGQQQGYRVYPGRDRRQFAALGLRPGDLIKDIDGQSLSDPTQAMQIFQSLGTAEQVSVTVERNGQPETIVLKTSQLEMGDKESE
jgi:general secretion pathway protein C